MNDQTKSNVVEPFTVVAGSLYWDEQQNEHENIKYLKSFSSLHEAQRDFSHHCGSYQFARIEWVNPNTNSKFELVLSPMKKERRSA